MKKIPLLILLAFFSTSGALLAQSAVPSADEVLQSAYKEAAATKKNVFIIFHASWCGWCHKMDTAMNDAVCKKMFDDNYVIRHLTVKESKNKKDLENPGADAFLAKHHGDEQGIPFWLVLDKNGNLLADSKIRKPGEGPEKGDNIGCPAEPAEVEAFIDVLKKTSALKDSQLQIIRTRFLKNKS